MDRKVLAEISGFSFLTCVQQSVMNFGILMVQGLVNSFGAVVMAAFAAAVKIDSFAYMPVSYTHLDVYKRQDFTPQMTRCF